MRRERSVRAALIAAVALSCTGVPAAAAQPGYWSCAGGAWIAVGRPLTPPPSRACGVEPAIPDDQAGCEKAGGAWGPVGIFPKPICRVPPAAGGSALRRRQRVRRPLPRCPLVRTARPGSGRRETCAARRLYPGQAGLRLHGHRREGLCRAHPLRRLTTRSRRALSRAGEPHGSAFASAATMACGL